MAKMLTYSCNMAAAKIGLKLGKERLHKYEKAFGVYEVPNKEMPGAVVAWHDHWEDWADVRTANISFGQGIAVTPLQVARIYSAIADGGVLMNPYIIKSILKPDGTVEESFHPVKTRRVISAATAKMVCKALGCVVSDGTARRTAQVEGYQVGGKTGSAQKAVPGRGYAGGGIVASFVGFLPLSNPRVVILVAVDEPKGSHFGATVAGPVFQHVAKKAMWRFKVPPDAEDDSDPTALGASFSGRKHAERSISTLRDRNRG
jgi:cell division protein FtsI/penicillin-binding protein 2